MKTFEPAFTVPSDFEYKYVYVAIGFVEENTQEDIEYNISPIKIAYDTINNLKFFIFKETVKSLRVFENINHTKKCASFSILLRLSRTYSQWKTISGDRSNMFFHRIHDNDTIRFELIDEIYDYINEKVDEYVKTIN